MIFEYLFELLGKLGYIVIYLAITILIEMLVLLFFKNRKTLFRPLLIANLITNPILNLILPAIYIGIEFLGVMFIRVSIIIVWSLQIIVLVLFEILVVFSEAYIIKFYTDLKFKSCFIYSLILNLVSFLLGLIINPIISSIIMWLV